MKYRIWNKTLKKWVMDEDGRVCEYNTTDQAIEGLQRLNQIKNLHPDHAADNFVIATHSNESD